MNKKVKNKKITKRKKETMISTVFLLAVSIPLIVLIIQLITEKNFDGNKFLMIMVSILVLVAFFVPGFLEKKFNLSIPSPIYISFIIFLYCSATLGEIRRFYYIYPWWDTFLHFFNGLILGTLGFSIVYLLIKSDKKIVLTPFFVALFALCFATTCGVVWEIFEYGNDLIFKTNMQKYMFENGKQMLGQAALIDTMNDFVTNLAGSLIPCIIGYFALKKDYKWADKFLIKKNVKEGI